MCNAWNHPIGCTCGWGGDGHMGGGRGCDVWNHPIRCTCGWGGDRHMGGGGATPPSPASGTSWKYRDDDFCSPTSCPSCGASVYFVRHNGGSVWFDDLGHPWPKHACFDNDISVRLQTTYSNESQKSKQLLFGVIVETLVLEPGESARITVKLSDGTEYTHKCNTSRDMVKSVGALVAIQVRNDGKTFIHWL